jgi:hypothetical protein
MEPIFMSRFELKDSHDLHRRHKMYHERILDNLALERRRDLMREAEKERLIRLAKTNGESRVLLTARWIISLGTRFLTWSTSSERNPGASIKIDLIP